VAITLNVTFNDTEQVRLEAILAELLTNDTPAQRRNKVEAECKSLLISRLKRAVERRRSQTLAAQIAAAQAADDAALVENVSPLDP
jgi:hypothetical protein